jgi:hypothetical protein
VLAKFLSEFQDSPGILALLCALAGLTGNVYAAYTNSGFWGSVLATGVATPVSLAAFFFTKPVIKGVLWLIKDKERINFLSKIMLGILLPGYMYAMFILPSFTFDTARYKDHIDQILLQISIHIILSPLILLIWAATCCLMGQTAVCFIKTIDPILGPLFKPKNRRWF